MTNGLLSSFAVLGAYVNDMEQNGEASMADVAWEIGTNMIPEEQKILQRAASTAGKAITVINTFTSVYFEDRDTYVSNKFETHAGDAYLDITIKSNLGDEIRSAQFYFKGESLAYVLDTGVMDAIGPGEARFRGTQNNINRKWKEEGYVGR